MAETTYQIETEIRDTKGKMLVRPQCETTSGACVEYRMHDLCETSRDLLGLPGSMLPYCVVITVRLVELTKEHDEDGPWLSETTVREISCERWVR